MGNSGSSDRPNERQKEWLKEHHEYQCKEAAKAIKEADMFLLSIGAGFSADSGLAVYNDIADIPAYHELNLEYHDLCTVQWFMKEEAKGIAYGFWGKCFNDYREATPHKGYHIIKEWQKLFFSKNELKGPDFFPNEFSRLYDITWNKELDDINVNDVSLHNPKIDPFFVFSSNVDSHPFRAGYKPEEVYEIHGTVENWQCMGFPSCGYADENGNIGTPSIWKAPKDFKFDIDINTMIALNTPSSINIDDTDKISSSFKSNFPTCIHCGKTARPNVLMFGDPNFIEDKVGFKRYTTWNELSAKWLDRKKKLVILEVGCGNNVPTVRCNSERILFNAPENTVTLIRVNPDYPLVHPNPSKNRAISIQGKGLATIELINEYLTNPIPEKLKYTPDTELYIPNDDLPEDSESDDGSFGDSDGSENEESSEDEEFNDIPQNLKPNK